MLMVKAQICEIVEWWCSAKGVGAGSEIDGDMVAKGMGLGIVIWCILISGVSGLKLCHFGVRWCD